MKRCRKIDDVRRALLEDLVDRPHYLTNALAQMGNPGYEALLEAVRSSSATIRCNAARGLGSTLREEVVPILQRLLETDHAESRTGARVSTAAKTALKTMARVARARAQSPRHQ
jgi:HEAT repeat protein